MAYMDNFLDDLFDDNFDLPEWVNVELFSKEWKKEVRKSVCNSIDDCDDTVDLECEMCPLVSVRLDLSASGGLDGKGECRIKIPKNVIFAHRLTKLGYIPKVLAVRQMANKEFGMYAYCSDEDLIRTHDFICLLKRRVL